MPESRIPQAPPAGRRIVTGHNDEGLSTVKYKSYISPQPVGDGTQLALLWRAAESPADVSSTEDKALTHTTTAPNGSTITTYDIPPRMTGLLHRSITLDYAVVLKGRVVLALEDGSKVALSEGDVVVQQATMHGWSNESDQWARLLGIMMPAKAPVVNGRELEAVWPF